MTGIVERIYISDQRKASVRRVSSAELEAHKGIVGDRYHGLSSADLAAGHKPRNKQLTLIAQEELDVFLANNNSSLDYGDFRRNIITSGINLNSLVDKEFNVGTALCRGFELCEPCATLKATVHTAVLPELVHKAGLRAVILEGGNIKQGSEIIRYQND